MTALLCGLTAPAGAEPAASAERCAALLAIDPGELAGRGDAEVDAMARCHEAAGHLSVAVALREQLLATDPEGPRAQETLYALAKNAVALTDYEDAAERFEAYAERYAADDRADAALRAAYELRLSLGDGERAEADRVKWESRYGRRDPRAAAALFWSRRAVLTSDAQRIQHARAYLKTYAARGGVDGRVVAEVALGQLLWRKACAQVVDHDLCLKVSRRAASPAQATHEELARLRQRLSSRSAPPKRCGSPTHGEITVWRRDRALADEAQARFAAALALSARAPSPPTDEPGPLEAYRDAVATARVYLADARFEAYLGLELPPALELHVDEWKRGSGVPKWEREVEAQSKRRAESVRRLAAFLEQKRRLGADLMAAYAEVRSAGSVRWTVTSLARQAGVLASHADQLYRAEVPAGVRSEDALWSFCDALADQAEAVEKSAVAGYEACVQAAKEAQVVSDDALACVAELQQRAPATHPANHGLLGAPRELLISVGVQGGRGGS